MKMSECMLSFKVFCAFVFKICISQGSTISPHDCDRIFLQQCRGMSSRQSVYEQNTSSSLTNDDLFQLRKGNCTETLTWKTGALKIMEISATGYSMENKTGNIPNSNENITCNAKNFLNVVIPQASLLSRHKQGKNHSLNGSPKKGMMSSREKLIWNVLVPQAGSVSRSKRDAAQNSHRRVNTLFGLQKSEDIFEADQSLEALLRKIIVDHISGCDLIIVYDEIYQETRTLETLVSFPVITQVLQLKSLEDLSEMIDWDSKNCQGTMFLMSDPGVLINFGSINKFFWAYKAKVIIVGLPLHSLEMFLKTTKGKKTEHVIGVVKDPINHAFEVYMNLLFWGEGMQLMTKWSGHRFTRRTNLFPDKTKDLRKEELDVVTFEYENLLFYEYDPDGTIAARHGRFVNLIRTFSEKFNFTINYIEVEEDFGQPLGNGSFDGVAGYLQRDEAHISLPFFYHTGVQDRHLAYDYARFIEDDKSCFLVRREAPRPAWQSLGLPFTPQSWIAVICGIILSGPIFYLLVIASASTGEEYENFKSLSYSSLIVIGIQIDHPLVIMPKRICNQIFIVFLLIYSLILTTGYRSNLISFITVARPPHQINTFKDLAESDLSVHAIDWFYYALEATGDPHLGKLLNRFNVKLTLGDFIDGFLEGKVATLDSRSTLEGISSIVRTKTGKPLARFLKDCVSSYTATIALPSRTPLKLRIDKIIARLFESGIPRKWVLNLNEKYKKVVERKGGIFYYPDIWHDVKDGLIPLGNSHLTGIWSVVSIGYFFATLSFAVEVMGHRG